ncbi:MAG: 1,4-beta-glucanase [Oscillospiraceae bacterium]|nr:1,4-beta-glucanase [Oscillospiraceae bacterium]
MKKFKKNIAVIVSALLLCSSVSPFSTCDFSNKKTITLSAATNSTDNTWGTMGVGGGGFVSGIITGKNNMYARTDVGGAYRYDYDKKEWVQMMEFVSDEDRGFLSVDALCVDPVDDNIIYMLCGCAYFSAERTAVFKSTDGGKTFTEHDVTDLIKVHGNGYGRQCGESIAVDPDNPDIIYCGGDTDGLIMSKDAGETWEFVESFDKLGLFTNEVKWPTWTETIEKTTVGTDYANCNGIATIKIIGGKVYIGVSDNTIGNNVYVADVGKDNWEPLSDDLPQDAFPSRINTDADGNLLISYVGGLTFNSTGGGIYKYDVKTGKVTDISPVEDSSFGSCVSTPDNPDELVASTCGVWSSQLWYKDAWNDEKVCWGDQFYRSVDGGATWESITPGNEKSWGGPLCADYLQDGGYSWIRNKAIHWCGTLVLDPRDDNRILVTSGNGVFACDNVWDELPVYYFHPNGIEEVVALDMVSVPGGNVYSAIGDYDGFIHYSIEESEQYSPQMGSTSAIAYCPSNPDVMVRYSENKANGYYTEDGGKTWKEILSSPMSSGKGAITELKDGTYRIFRGGNYSDDFGKTWSKSSGITATSNIYLQVDSEKPNYVYAGGNDNNGYDPTCKPNNYLYVSDDYGATFTAKKICDYDKAEEYSRIAMVTGTSGKVLAPAGYHGLYVTKDYGNTFTKFENVDTCFAVGVGAAKDSTSPLTIYIWGQCNGSGITGAYASTDDGATWVRVNDDEHQYGGPGNGKFIVGDMNTFGTYYMSTVGMGIMYHTNAFGSVSGPQTPPQTTEPTTTTPTTTAPPQSNEKIYGDLDGNKIVDLTDLTLLSLHLIGDKVITDKAILELADVNGNDEVNLADMAHLKQYICKDDVILGKQS